MRVSERIAGIAERNHISCGMCFQLLFGSLSDAQEKRLSAELGELKEKYEASEANNRSQKVNVLWDSFLCNNIFCRNY